MQRSAAEKYRDEQELKTVRDKQLNNKPPPGRHSRFGGTYIMQNVKSISDKDSICHQQLERAMKMEFDHDKNKRKQTHRIVKEEGAAVRRSALSIRYAMWALFTLHMNTVKNEKNCLTQHSTYLSHIKDYFCVSLRLKFYVRHSIH